MKKRKLFGVSNKELNKRYKSRLGSSYGEFGNKTFDNQFLKIEETEDKGVIGWIIKWLLKP